MQKFDITEKQVLSKILNTENLYVEVLQEKRNKELLWIVVGSFVGRNGWEFVNSKKYPKGITRDDLVGKLLQYFIRYGIISDLKYSESGNVTISKDSKDLAISSANDLLELLLGQVDTSIRMEGEF